ncbi:MAG TPA: tRNA lysidine(34) synthetase TilS [Anaerolineaceae bacterium]|nr:tRNA lysidine(34) synthetase TilS [Anaerolineaceae bacterium]
MDLHHFLETAQSRCGLGLDRSIVAAVSGGADSLCLLLRLAQSGFPVIVAHFDHRLRPDSQDDARFVEEIARRLGFPFVYEAGDVGQFAREHSLSIEEAARTMRYRFLFRQARLAQAQAVATGHTADDQVETVLMHLLRGSGLAGLKGMTHRTVIPEWDASLPLVRPILDFWRADTERCCREAGITPIQDQTNAETTYFRNRLRHELVPLLETYNPAAKDHVARTAEILAGDHALLEDLTRQALAAATRSRGPGHAGLSLPVLRAMPEALLRRVLRAVIATLVPELRDLDFAAVERAAGFVHHPSGSGRIELIQAVSMQVERETLYVTAGESIREPDWVQMEGEDELRLNIPGQVEISPQWMVTAEELACRPAEIPPEQLHDPLQAWLDAGSLDHPLQVRVRRPGDRFQPLGVETGTAKISDYFTNRKLPRPARDRWPLVVSAGRIAWVPGFAPAHWARVGPETSQVVRLTLRKVADHPSGT